MLLTGPLHATMHLFAAVHTLWLGAELTDRPDRATAVHAVPAVLGTICSPRCRRRRRCAPRWSPERRCRLVVADEATARGVVVTEYYGAAELSFVAAARHPGPLRPFPGAEVQLRDGEIWVRSPYLATGYGSGVTGPLRRDRDGFATVGDLGDWLGSESAPRTACGSADGAMRPSPPVARRSSPRTSKRRCAPCRASPPLPSSGCRTSGSARWSPP